VAGVRIDVAQGLVKDRELRDNPPATEADHAYIRQAGLRPVYNTNRPEVHEIYRRWRRIADAYDPPGLLMGETWVLDLESLVRFYGDGSDELDLAQNFPFMFSELGDSTRSVVELTEATMPAGAWPVWAASNHDAGRFPTRWCGGDERKIRAALLMLLTLRGTPILYYGDELGMPEVQVPPDRMLDPVGLRGLGGHMTGGRDRMRTPMPWTEGPGAGFSPPGVEPWLPVGAPGVSVERQRTDPGSVLHLCRDTIALRRERPELAVGPVRAMPSPDGVWAWRRGERTAVVLDLSDRPAEVSVGPATVLLHTRGGPAGETLLDPLRLGPWDGVVLEVEP
jgi:alpha-glucosidase